MAWYRLKGIDGWIGHAEFCQVCKTLISNPAGYKWLAHVAEEISDDEATVLLLDGYVTEDGPKWIP